MEQTLIIVLGVVGYLFVGYVWTMFFRGYFLKDLGGNWQDSNFGIGSALFVTVAWPIMTVVIILAGFITGLSWLFGPGLRKLYRLPEKSE